MTYLPAVELADLLRPAYGPCPEFEGAYGDVARWAPEEGHVPRGYTGACGTLGEVEVVLLLAEPGDPLDRDAFPPSLGARDFIADASANTRSSYERCTTRFHANMRIILDLLFAGAGLGEQLRKAWIGETYLCSAPAETGRVPAPAERACAGRFLARQLRLLPGRPVVALGGKAQARVRWLVSEVPGLESRLVDAWAASPPGANNPRARQSSRASRFSLATSAAASKSSTGVLRGGRLDVEWNCHEVGNPVPRINMPALRAGTVLPQPVIQMLAALTIRPRQLQPVGQRRNPRRTLHAHASHAHRSARAGKIGPNRPRRQCKSSWRDLCAFAGEPRARHRRFGRTSREQRPPAGVSWDCLFRSARER